MIERPFFVVGSERSGTTMLRLMLDHHPRIACHFEFDHVILEVTDGGRWPDVAGYVRRLSPRVHHFSDPVVDSTLTYPELVDSFLVQKQKSRGNTPLIGGTVHKHFDRLLSIWPDARFIHLFRDGRDVARSCIQMGWDGHVFTAIDGWIEAEATWVRLAGILGPERFVDVRYEDLVARPEAELERICRFLGDQFDARMLSYPSTSTYAAPDPKHIYGWRAKMTREEVEVVESKASDHLLRLGYELSGFPIRSYTASQARRFESVGRWARRRQRLRRIGPVLMTLDFITRKVPITWLRKVVDRRVEAIEAAYIK